MPKVSAGETLTGAGERFGRIRVWGVGSLGFRVLGFACRFYGLRFTDVTFALGLKGCFLAKTSLRQTHQVLTQFLEQTSKRMFARKAAVYVLVSFERCTFLLKS